MIPLARLRKLHPAHRRKKIALTLESLERELRAGREIDRAYAGLLLGELSRDEGLSEALRLRLASVMAEWPSEAVRCLNLARNDLLAEIGESRADWDFLGVEGHGLDPLGRSVLPGTAVYLEDLRSPFNVGSIMRSAEAFGLEELLLSPFTADPGHPRALRSSMGAASVLPWRRSSLDELEGREGLFALELGGTPLADFDFPETGFMLVGSEELGLSSRALSLCERRLSIPLRGAKASLNVGVAFGIAMQAWGSALTI